MSTSSILFYFPPFSSPMPFSISSFSWSSPPKFSPFSLISWPFLAQCHFLFHFLHDLLNQSFHSHIVWLLYLELEKCLTITIIISNSWNLISQLPDIVQNFFWTPWIPPFKSNIYQPSEMFVSREIVSSEWFSKARFFSTSFILSRN